MAREVQSARDTCTGCQILMFFARHLGGFHRPKDTNLWTGNGQNQNETPVEMTGVSALTAGCDDRAMSTVGVKRST